MKKAMAFVLALTMAFVLVACSSAEVKSSTPPQPKETESAEVSANTDFVGTIKIGFINPMSSGQAAYGELQFKGATLAINEINAAGGVLDGYKLELSVFDDQSDSTQSVAGAQQFINDPGVVAVLGCNNSGCTLAVAPLLEREDMLLVNASSSAMGLMEYRNFFRTLNDSAAQTAYSASWSHEVSSNAAVVVVNNDWGLDMEKGFVNAFTELGGEVLCTERADAGQNDFRSIITRIKTLDPGLVYIALEGDYTAPFAQQAQELGLDCVFMGSTALNNEIVLQAAGHDLDGFYFLTEFYPYDTAERVANFVGKYQAAYNGELPGQQSANAYETIYVIYHAIEKAGSLERADILQGAYDMDGFDCVTGNIAFGGDGGHSLLPKEYTRMIIQDGAFAMAK